MKPKHLLLCLVFLQRRTMYVQCTRRMLPITSAQPFTSLTSASAGHSPKLALTWTKAASATQQYKGDKYPSILHGAGTAKSVKHAVK